MKKRYLSTGSEWTFELLQNYDEAIGAIAKDYQLDTYPNQIEVITAEQMMDAYSSAGLPVAYHHWSFGKQFLSVEKNYKRGYMGLAYEIVINSDPCIAYLMEENSMAMQALVIAHACYGHNSFFKGNYLFQTWTNAESIIDYIIFAKNYIAKCEEQYGLEAVESTLDACHALMNFGVDRYQRPTKLSWQEENLRQQAREAYLQSQVNELWSTVNRHDQTTQTTTKVTFPQEPQENLLYFIEKNAPLLEPWQREIVRIIRKMAQYFYPQRQTQIMNEGWACFWHYTLMHGLYDQGLVTDEFMIEFLQSHTNVIFQPEFHDKHYTGINPYALGFNMMMDIKRIAQNPTEEDKAWFPELANSDWLQALKFAMQSFKDESFIAQYLSPKLIRDFKLFALLNDERQDEMVITAIHDDAGYQSIRQALSKQYDLSLLEPNIQISHVDLRRDRALTLQYLQNDSRPLHEDQYEVLKHLHQLWGFDIKLETLNDCGKVVTCEKCPADPKGPLGFISD